MTRLRTPSPPSRLSLSLATFPLLSMGFGTVPGSLDHFTPSALTVNPFAPVLWLLAALTVAVALLNPLLNLNEGEGEPWAMIGVAFWLIAAYLETSSANLSLTALLFILMGLTTLIRAVGRA